MQDSGYKRCTRCGETKPLNEFYRESAVRGGGPISRCKPCFTAKTREYRQRRKEQNRARRDQERIERFWSNVVEVDGCWEWQGYRNRAGYGQITWSRQGILAHRHAYALTYGPIPDGMVIDHLCRNPPCIRPDHMEPVTIAENSLRGKPGIRPTHCPHGHPYVGDNVYYRFPERQRWPVCRVCARAQRRARRAAKP